MRLRQPDHFGWPRVMLPLAYLRCGATGRGTTPRLVRGSCGRRWRPRHCLRAVGNGWGLCRCCLASVKLAPPAFPLLGCPASCLECRADGVHPVPLWFYLSFLQLFEVDLEEELALWWHCRGIHVCKGIDLPQEVLAFCGLEGSEAVMVQRDIAIDPLRVCDAQDFGNELFHPAGWHKERGSAGEEFALKNCQLLCNLALHHVPPAYRINLFGEELQMPR